MKLATLIDIRQFTSFCYCYVKYYLIISQSLCTAHDEVNLLVLFKFGEAFWLLLNGKQQPTERYQHFNISIILHSKFKRSSMHYVINIANVFFHVFCNFSIVRFIRSTYL